MERHFFMISRALNARKRKIFALFFALAASIGLSYALTPLSGDVWDEDTKTLTVNSTPQGDYYHYQNEIKHVVISSSVTEIGEQAFSDCLNMESVVAYDGLQVIDQSAFFSCQKLESVILPSTLREVRYSAFASCDNLKSVTINAPSLENYAEYAFDDTHADLKIYVPEASVNTYKSNWSAYADHIVAIGSGSTPEPVDPTEGIEVPEGGEIFVLTDSIMNMNSDEGAFMFMYDGEGWVAECQYMIWHTQTMNAESRWNRTTMNMVGTDGPEFGSNRANVVRLEINFASTTGGGALAEGWSLSGNKYIWTGSSKSARFYHTGATISGITSVVYVFDGKCHRDPQRFADTVKIEDLVVGDTLAMGTKMNSDQYFLFRCAPNRARRHGNLWTSDFESFFLESADAISKHGAIDLENPDGLRGCLEPVNENGELAEEWIVTSTNPFTIAGIGKAEITNHSYNSDVDYAALEPGDTITFGATILNTPEKVWFLANRMQRIFSSGETSIIDDDRYMEGSYGTIGKNGVIKADNYGTTQVPINEQGTLGGKWVVKFYSPLTIAGIGYPMPTLTLSDKVSIVGMPVAGINDIGNNNYEVEPGTQFQIQAAAAPEHYSFVGWSDLASTDPNYSANPRTITINSDSTIQPIYAIDTYTLTLGVNDESRGSVKIAKAQESDTIYWDAQFCYNVETYIDHSLQPVHNYNSKDGITVTMEGYDEMSGWVGGFFHVHKTDEKLIFTSTVGDISKIIIHNSVGGYPQGWMVDYDGMIAIWEGTPSATVELPGEVITNALQDISMEFIVGGSAGKFVDNGDGTYTVDWGTELKVIATPAEGYHLASWSNGAEVTGDTLALTVTGELALTANFAHVPYMITLPEGVSIVAPVPAGITDKGNGVYEIVEGTEFQISADIIPEHYHFGHWADLADSVAQYSANPRTIVAGENLTIEPIFAVDTYTLTLATNDSTKGVVSVKGAGSGAGASVGEMISLSEKQTENPVMGEYFQVAGEGVNYDGRIIGQSNDYKLTISSQNGEKLDFIVLKVSSKSLWSGYTVSSTAGDVEDLLDDNYTIRVSNINATSVTISRSGTTANPTGHITVSNVYVNEEIPFRFDITDFEFPNSGNVLTGNGVTLTAGGSFDLVTPQIVGGGTFTTDLGNFTKIEIYAMGFSEFSGEGWTEEGDYERIWTGNASSVSFDGAVIGDGMGSIYISYTIALASAAATGIVDNGDGTYTVDYGTELTFVAKPAEDFMLDSWSNGAPVTGDTLKLTMTEELSLTANFKHIPATITLPEGVNIVEPMPAGITSKGEGVYEVEYGTEFQISADSIPAHYHFDHWADLADSVAQYAANPRTIVAGENLTIEPIFAIDTYTLTLATNDSTKGVVSVEGAGQGGEQGGQAEPITVIITNQDFPSEGNSFTKDGVTVSAETMSANYIADGTFSTTLGNITRIQVTSDARDASGDGWVGSGKTWAGTPASSVPFSGYYSDMHGSIGIKFVITIEPTAAPKPASGIVDNGDGTYTVDWGTELTFTAKAADGYHVQSWSNGAEVNDLVEATQTITMTEAFDLSAIFAENPIITLATNDSTMGIVTLAGAGNQLTVEGSNTDVNQNVPIRTVSSTDTRTMSQSIYPAALLSGIAGDSISGMTYYISEPGAHVLTATYVVKLMETEQAAFSDAVAVNTESATTVYTGTIDVTGNTLDIVFDQPYAYNGGNLLVEFSISSASHQNALAKFSVFASQGGSFQQYYNFGFEEMRYYTYDFLAKTTFNCGGQGIPGVIDLGNGQYNVLPGTELTFVAQPAERFMLESWSNGAPVNGDSLTITVTEPLSLTANFKYIPAVITLPEGVNIVEPLPTGITDNGDGTYTVEHGTEFQISADGAPEHYHFDHWTDLDSTNTEYYANPRTVVADTNITAEPFYTIDTYTITLASNDTTMGQLTIEQGDGIVDNGDGTYTIDWGTELTIKATAATGYHVDSWSNGEAVNDLVEATQTITVTDGFDLSALFVANPVITLGTNQDAWGTVVIDSINAIPGLVNFGDGSYSVLPGTELTLVAVPAEDYHLLSWSNGAAVTADNKQTVVVTDELSISATFKHDTYILTVSDVEVQTAKFADGHAGAVVLNPGVLNGVQAGDSVKLTTTAAYNSANVGDNLTIMIHYEIEVIDGGIYDNEYALQVSDETYQDKGAIIEPMNPDEDATPEEGEAEVEEGLEIYAYGYCHGSEYSIRYHLKSGNPDQYKVVFADSRFTNVDWTDLETAGKDGTIDVEIPVDVPTGDYSMTITFRDSRYTWLESAPITVTLHVNLPETYTVVLFDNVMAVVDTCQCLTDIQWYHRENNTDPWEPIPGANGYYYKQEGGLSGQYFIKAKMNGVDTYTCPQTDVETLYGDDAPAEVILRVSPNPVVTTTNLTVEGSDKFDHNMRIVNVNGWEVYNDTFEGVETTVDMSNYPQGNYMISVDGVVITVIKK